MTTLSDIVDTIHKENNTGLNKAQIENVSKLVFSNVSGALAAGNDVSINNFGKFEVHRRDERPGRNPSTGEAITLKASASVKFKAGKALKDQVS